MNSPSRNVSTKCNLLTNIIPKKQFAWKDYHCKNKFFGQGWFLKFSYASDLCLQSSDGRGRQLSLMWGHWKLLSEEMEVLLIGTSVCSYEGVAKSTSGLSFPLPLPIFSWCACFPSDMFLPKLPPIVMWYKAFTRSGMVIFGLSVARMINSMSQFSLQAFQPKLLL